MAKEVPTLDRDFETRGFWYIPSAPENRVSGTLRFVHDQELRLELDGTLHPDNMDTNATFAPEVVLGETHEGRACTLVHVHECTRTVSMPGIEVTSMAASYAFIGAHFASVDAIRLMYVDLRLTHLESWLDHRPFTSASDRSHKDGPRIHVDYEMPASRRVSVPSLGATVAFRAECTTNQPCNSYHLRHSDIVRIRPKEPVEFQWFWAAAYGFRGLLSLLMWEPVYPVRMTAGLRRYRTAPGLYTDKTVEIIFPQKGMRPRESLSPFMMLIPYAAVRKLWHRILDLWFEDRVSIRTVHNLVLGNLNDTSTFLQHRFLTHAQALESYHRRRSKGRYVSAAQYERFREVIQAAIPTDMPGDLKQAMVSRLKYGNEYSLRKRMKLLLGSLSRQSRHLVSEHEAAFVDSVVATRNYLTHYDPESKDAALDGVALSKVNTQLQKLLLLLLLKDIGIDEEVVGNAIAKHGRFRQHYVTW